MEKFGSRVTNISWERIYMFVDLELDMGVSDEVQFYLVDSAYRVEAAFELLERTGNRVKLKLNVTNNGTNRCVNNGIYTLLTVDGEDWISEAGYTGTSHTLEDWGRCYRYLSNKGAYTVTFLLDEYSEESRFQLLFYNTVRRAMANRIVGTASNRVSGTTANQISVSAGAVKEKEPEKSDGKIKAKLRGEINKWKNRWASPPYKWIKRLYIHWNKKAHKNENRKKNILFLSEQDDQLALNMQALLDRMRERGLEEQFNIDFSLRKATSEKQTARSFYRMLKLVAQADLIIVDDHVPLFNRLVLKDNTQMIQIWHAGAGFKGVGYSRWGHAGCPGPFSAHRQYDYCISGSSNISGFFSEQFGILDEQIIPTGMPRMDIYLNQENRTRITEELYQRIPQARDNKVILFAPTYRGQNRAKAYYPYEKVDFDGLYRLCEEKGYIVLFKMHPWVSDSVPIQAEHQDRFFDLNEYPNINELFYITDLLITDYSSSIYEFSLMDKPMLFFAYDKVQYSTSRGFHRDYDSTVPGRVCEDFADVMDALEKEDFHFEKVAKYKEEHFDFVDDHAADRIIDWLILGNLPEEYSAALQRKRDYVSSVRGLSFRECFVSEADEV